ncbi:MAG: BREX-1 system adenine-specific DNA-methyltransferase PglX [Bacteroidales bacterium]
MKLADHVEHIRQLIDKAFRNRLGRMGITATSIQPLEVIPMEYHEDRNRIKSIREVFISETGSVAAAYEKLVEEFTFTLFNRLAALKVIEAHVLHPEIVTRRTKHGGRSFAHFLWLEQNPLGRNEEQEGLVRFLKDQLAILSADIPLFSPNHPYHLLPTAIELNGIMNAFNQVEDDPQVENDIWKSDDVLGWLYESYNNYKKAAHKASGDKTEYHKVSIQSQVYTPRWVVKFLIDNSLGKLYLEMYPDSSIREKYKIANAPTTQIRDRKRLTEIGLIDPATGSGNFLLYGFDLFYDLYIDQIEHYDADYDESDIPELIIRHNLHGIDLDDRAVQLAQLGLYIKAKRKKRFARIDHFNIVSSDFFLPEYDEIRHLFENGEPLSPELESIVSDLWADLQQAYKFGSLIRLEERFNSRLQRLVDNETKGNTLFKDERIVDYEQFRDDFLANLQKAVAHNTERQGLTFLNTKTSDAITFLQLLTRKYDVAVANPPYTDSGDYGPELKAFVEDNYKTPLKFNANLFSAFIKRNSELLNEAGKLGMIHPLTFMYIKSFEDVREYIIEKFHINIFVDYGLSDLFGLIMAAPAMYVLERGNYSENKSLFISLDQYTRTPHEKDKKEYLLNALNDYLNNVNNKHNYVVAQKELKKIDGYPFVYWINNSLRDIFIKGDINNNFNVAAGLQTGNNDRFVRYWWEIKKDKIISELDLNGDWALYAKGGPKNNWYGNNWTVVNWENNGNSIKNYFDKKGKLKSRPQNERYYFQDGITYSFLGGKKVSFRLLKNSIFDVSGSSLFPKRHSDNILYAISYLNSNLSLYILSCLNPTVNTQIGDIERIPYVLPPQLIQNNISSLAAGCIAIKKQLNFYRLIEINFEKSPLLYFPEASIKDRLLAYLNYENAQITQVLLYEAVINQLITKVYELSDENRQQVELKMGKPVGEIPILDAARKAYLVETTLEQEIVRIHIQNLTTIDFEEQQVQAIKSEFSTLYQSNNDLEEFCIRHQVNPINVWYWFKESKLLPPARAAEIALEFMVDACRTILIEDEDGIVPLIGLPGEPRLMDRFEQYCLSQGFTSAQFMQLDGLLGRPLNEYLEHHFFKNLCDHLNLFMYLPKTPFIWHLSSGEHQGFEAYIIIYKWNRDSLFKLKTQYLSKRADSLEYRLIQLKDSETAQAQNEKEKIRLQLQEIAVFTEKIDELIAEGYDPKLDDGVGKNIAPLQKKGLLRCEVLNAKQLEKYLNADW